MSVSFFRRFTKRILISLNILTILLFLAGCYNSWFNPKYFWFIGFCTLASLYLLLVIIGFTIFWLFVKRWMVYINLIAIIIAWKPLREVIKLKSTTDFTLIKNEANLRVMSWNVEHFDILEHKTKPEVKDQMLELINKYDPDIACFQEMVGSDVYPEAINYVPDIAKTIGMPYYYYSYNKKLDFDHHHHFGIIIFSKHPIIRQHTLSYAPNTYNDIFQYADVLVGKDTLRVFNLHLQSLRFTQENMDYLTKPVVDEGKHIKESMSVLKKFKTGFLLRSDQSDFIKKSINESPYPVIVCGDFNDVPNSYAYATIGKNLKNVFTEKGAGIGRTFSSISPTLRIDNIFTDKVFTIEQYTRVRKKLSDHFPIISDLFYNKVQAE